MLTRRTLLLTLIWAAALLGALSIAKIRGDWGHSICGPWGCGPPLQALVSCHVAWLVFLSPLALAGQASDRVTATWRRRIGLGLLVSAIATLAAFAIHERAAWWPPTSQWQQNYYWQRLGFVIATTVDVPALEALLIGGAAAFRGARRPVDARSLRPIGEDRVEDG